LPMFSQLTDADVARVIGVIAEWSRVRHPRSEGAST
jgi:hypothetical protein